MVSSGAQTGIICALIFGLIGILLVGIVILMRLARQMESGKNRAQDLEREYEQKGWQNAPSFGPATPRPGRWVHLPGAQGGARRSAERQAGSAAAEAEAEGQVEGEETLEIHSTTEKPTGAETQRTTGKPNEG